VTVIYAPSQKDSPQNNVLQIIFRDGCGCADQWDH